MFYVYTLNDPRDGSVFYVGKGKGARIEAHEREAAKGVYSRKCQRIRDIWASGGKVTRLVVERFKDEGDAYAAEAGLIETIGLDRLTNVVPGGYGAPAKPRVCTGWTVAMLRKVAPSMRRAIAHMTVGGLFIGDNDITGLVRDLIETIRRDVGDDAFNAALAH